MGPRPTLKGELKRTPERAAYGAGGSAIGMAAPKLVMNPKVAEGIAGTLESVGTNPRLYTRALLKGATKGVEGTPEAIAKAAQKGGEAVGKFEADAIKKDQDVKKQMAAHWVDKGYGDPVKGELNDPGPEPTPEEFKKKFGTAMGSPWAKEYAKAKTAWEKATLPPTPTKTTLSSIYNRYSASLRGRGKTPPVEEVPELVKIKRLAQDKIKFDPQVVDPKQKLSDDDYRRLGKITNAIDKRVGFLDPKQKAIEEKLSEAYKEKEKVQSSSVVKAYGGRKTPLELQERLGTDLTRVPKSVSGADKSAASERTMEDLRNVESKSGTKFVDDATNNMAKNYYSKALPQGRQPWMRRMAFGLPLSVAAGAMGGNKPSSYMMSMMPLMAMMSPALMAQILTKGLRGGPQILSQALRSANDSGRE